MQAKILVWIGVGIIALTIILLLVWAGLAGFLPRITVQVDMPEVPMPPLSELVVKGLDMVAQAIAAPLHLIATFLMITSQQIIEAFFNPSQ